MSVPPVPLVEPDVPPPFTAQAAQPLPRPKKKASTLTIVLSVIGDGMMLVFLGIAIAIYMVMSSPQGRAIVGVVGDAVKISAKAQKAPGTKELRALGCTQAISGRGTGPS